MAKLVGINVTTSIVPGTTEDIFPTHQALYGKGGWREVATIVERDTIPDPRLEEGMAVYVKADNIVYILSTLDTSTTPYTKTWTEFKTGSSDGIRKTESFSNFEPGYAGEIVQYIGITDANYTHGYFYQCTGRTTVYSNIQFVPLGDYEIAVSISDTDLNTFLNETVRQTTFPVTNGRFGYYQQTPTVLWYLSGSTGHRYDGFSYSNSPEGYAAQGFTVTPPIGPRQGLDYTVDNTTTWNWEQINVQPDLEVIDNLTSTSTTSALSANQGKVLQDTKIEYAAEFRVWEANE